MAKYSEQIKVMATATLPEGFIFDSEEATVAGEINGEVFEITVDFIGFEHNFIVQKRVGGTYATIATAATFPEVMQSVIPVLKSDDEQFGNVEVSSFTIQTNLVKTGLPATYAQYKYLIALGANVELNATQFTKRVSIIDASNAINAAKDGRQVTILA